MSVGVMLTRAQPFHLGHLKTLKLILEENDFALLIIGSANKCGTKRNPFPVKMRKKQVKDAIHFYMPLEEKRVKVITLNDWSKEDFTPAVKEWGQYLYYVTVNAIGAKKFRFYYNDDIHVVEDWFTEVLKERIKFRTLDRSDVADGISSTQLRCDILQKKYKDVKQNLLQTVTKKDFLEMKNILKKVEKNPLDDYMME